MKHIFIVNPTSGSGKANQVAFAIKKVCEEENIDYEIIYTRCAHDGTEITKALSKNEDIIYAVGGDGTLNEVVNGIVDSSNKLGIIPAGSGNDFYRTIKNIYEPNYLLDVGMVNNEYFINVASVGLDAEMANIANMLKEKKVPNGQIYNASIVIGFFSYQTEYLKIKINEEEIKNNFTIVTVCNGRYYGNGYPIAPLAKVDDGLFDIYLVDKLFKLEIPGLILNLKKAKHEQSKHVSKYQSEGIYIKANHDILCNLDGEVRKNKEYNFKVLKKKIELYNNRYLTEKIMKNC